MKSSLARQLRDFAPLTIIVLVGVLTHKWWQPYLFASTTSPSGDQSNQIGRSAGIPRGDESGDRSSTTLTPQKMKADTSNNDDDDVTPMAASGQKVAFQPTELQSLDSQTLTPKPNEVPPPAEDAPYLPNRKRTPGAIFTGATREIICVPGYTKRVRHVPVALKKQAYNAYGIKHHAKGEYEVDHLVSLELGGSNDITNLWPEPYHGLNNAHAKDKLENEMHHRVCAGTLTLAQAQKEIAFDWLQAYHKYVELR